MDDDLKITLYEADLYEKKEIKENVRMLVVFRIAQEWHAVDMAKVKEVIKYDQITFLPSAPAYITGIFNLRGNILSVTDLKDVFALTRDEIPASAKLVIIESGALVTALLADEVIEPLKVPVGKIDPPLTTISPQQADYIEGQCKVDQKLIGILRVEKILGQYS